MPFLMLVAEDIPASRYLLSLLQLRHTQAEMRASAGNPTFCLGTFLLQSRLDHRQLCDGGRLMSTMQAFFLGMMMAWTPSLLILAFALWDVPFSSEPDQVERPEQGPA